MIAAKLQDKFLARIFNVIFQSIFETNLLDSYFKQFLKITHM